MLDLLIGVSAASAIATVVLLIAWRIRIADRRRWQRFNSRP